MNKKQKNYNNHKTNKGFSIIELMVALLIGVIILTGLITVFDNSQRMSRTQNGLARIQENGRYALSLLRDQISQTGYSYCFGQKSERPILGGAVGPLPSSPPPPIGQAPTKIAWDVQTTNFIPGLPTETLAGGVAFDPGYLLFGHDCDGAGNCIPALTAQGADITANIPAVGAGDGDRIGGTDVLTIRYLRGGREVANIDPATSTVNFTAFAAANPPDSMPASGQVLIMSCEDTSPVILDIATNGAGALTTVQPPPAMSYLTKAFNLQRDFMNITYYVANNIVDGRSIPTLYSSVNGFVNPIIEGVDAFDVIYGVKDGFANTMFLNAGEVQNDLDGSNCWPAPELLSGGAALPGGTGLMTNNNGCGWRSVATVEIYLLLNTIYNSSTGTDVQFRYSQYDKSAHSSVTAIPSAIPNYNMHRKEFTATIALKNIMH